MNANHKQAAKDSKSGQTMFVVYVPDQGQEVFTKEQLAIYSPLVFIEAAYLNGKQIAQ